jgi:hypothetical protein
MPALLGLLPINILVLKSLGLIQYILVLRFFATKATTSTEMYWVFAIVAFICQQLR